MGCRGTSEFPQVCQGPFGGLLGKVGFLSRRRSGKGPQLALRGESPGFSRVAVEFLLSYDGDLRDPLVGPQVDPISIRVMEGPSGFLCSSCQGRGPHLDLRPEPQGSSPGRPGSQGFLGRPQGSQASSHVEPCKSALLSSLESSVRLPVELTIGIGGFLLRHHRAVSPAIVFCISPRGDR